MALCLHIGVTALVGTGGADGILSTHGSHDVGGWLGRMSFCSHTEVTTLVGGSDAFC